MTHPTHDLLERLANLVAYYDGKGGTDACMGLDDRDNVEAAIQTIRELEAENMRLRKIRENPAISAWRPIETAPYRTPVRIMAGDMSFKAQLMPDASINDDGETCDQWVAVNEGEHPPCWSDGACWESNEDGFLSLRPTAWLPLPDTSAISGETGK